MNENPYKPPTPAADAPKKPPQWVVNAGWTAIGALAGLAIIVIGVVALIALAIIWIK
jgi:hypothetical protein